MLPPSAISIAALQLRELLSPPAPADPSEQILPPAQILIGHPKSAIDIIEASGAHHINLFFYHLENAAYPTDATSDDPFFIKLYILITAFGNNDAFDNTSAGEDELRLIGAIMQRFHEKPVIRLKDAGGEEIAYLQLIPHTLTLDDINHIWSAQGDSAYRLSVGYEIALVPIPLAEKVENTSSVGSIGVEATSNLKQQPLSPSGLVVDSLAPLVSRSTIDISRPDWVPQICFVEGGSCRQTLSFDVESSDFATFTPRIWIAGDPAEEIDLIWEVWKSDGWAQSGPIIKRFPYSKEIDPEGMPSTTATFPAELVLPLSLGVDEFSGQAILYAVRQFTPVASDEPLEVRSNLLLISFYRARS
jgi:hypothetical protein